LPWQIAPWRDKAPALLLAGPAGTGKSRLAGEKVHGYLLKYPGATGLVLRKTRESMVNSTLLFLARTIIGRDPRVRLIKHEHRFDYWNGSILAYGGMKDEEQREQVRGIGIEAGVDIAWMEESARFSKDDYNEVSARMRGRAAAWQQIILATNPGPPSHWINQEMILGGEASTYDKARPDENPYNPAAYIERLKRLTGILYQRLWLGLWVQAEGLVYEEFDLDNLTDDEPDMSQPFELAFDDGYIDPRAILFIQRQPGRILVFDELYHSRHLAEKCVHEMLEACALHSGSMVPHELDGKSLQEVVQWCREVDPDTGTPNAMLPEIAIGSPEAKELAGRFRLADVPARGKGHQVVEMVAAVRELVCDGNGYRTLQVNRRCKNLIREMTEGYRYPEGATRDNEKPMDGNDHACEALGNWVWLRAR
jgi:PBSX family phage terminase large subunit